MTDTHLTDFLLLKILQVRLDTSFDRAYAGLPSYADSLQSPFTARLKDPLPGPTFQVSVKTESTAPTHSIATSGASTAPMRRSQARRTSLWSTTRPSGKRS